MDKGGDDEVSQRGYEGGRRTSGEIVPILYTAKEAAALCMISESNFYKMNRKGLVPKPMRIGTILRWRKDDLVEWVSAGCPKDWNGSAVNSGRHG